jgi:tellurite resistance protein TerC
VDTILWVLPVLAFDLGVVHREAHEISARESLNMSVRHIGLGLAWAAVVYWNQDARDDGQQARRLEQSGPQVHP